MVSVITPWKDHPELLADYQQAVARVDQVIVVLNGTTDAVTIESMGRWMATDPRVTVIHSGKPIGFSAANNLGVQRLHDDTGIVCFLNNDIVGSPDWVDDATNVTSFGLSALFGAAMVTTELGPYHVPFLPGWCVFAERWVWNAIGWWRELPAPYYWEDVELCLRAGKKGYSRFQPTGFSWKLTHKGNVTMRDNPSIHHLGAINESFLLDEYGRYLGGDHAGK